MTKLGWLAPSEFIVMETSGIDLENSSLDIELAKRVGEYFSLTEKQMNRIIQEVEQSVSAWKEKANKLGIPPAQIRIMEPAFGHCNPMNRETGYSTDDSFSKCAFKLN